MERHFVQVGLDRFIAVALREAMPLSRFGQFSFWGPLFMCTMGNGEKYMGYRYCIVGFGAVYSFVVVVSFTGDRVSIYKAGSHLE